MLVELKFLFEPFLLWEGKINQISYPMKLICYLLKHIAFTVAGFQDILKLCLKLTKKKPTVEW